MTGDRLRRAVSFAPAVICFLLLFLLLPGDTALAALTAILCHEGGHIAVYFCFRRQLPRFTGQAGGLLLSGGWLSYWQEALYAAGGAAVNLFSFACIAALSAFMKCPPFLCQFGAFSLLYGGFNLLPVPPLDGGRLLYLCCLPLGEENAFRIARGVSCVLIGVFLFGSLYFCLFRSGFFYGIFLSCRFLAAHLDTFGEKTRKSEENRDKKRIHKKIS